MSKKTEKYMLRMGGFVVFFALMIFLYVLSFKLEKTLNALTITLLIVGPVAASMFIRHPLLKAVIALICYAPNCVFFYKDIPLVVFFFLPAVFFILLSNSLKKDKVNETACTLYITASLFLSISELVYTVLHHQQTFPGFSFSHMNFFQLLSITVAVFLIFKVKKSSKVEKRRSSYSQAMLLLIVFSFVADFIYVLFCSNDPSSLLYIMNWSLLYGCMIYDENPHVVQLGKIINSKKKGT